MPEKLMDGYIRVSNDVFETQNWSPSALLLYLYLRAHDKGNGKPVSRTYQTMSKDLGLSVNSIRLALDTLIRWNFITKRNTKHKQKYGTNKYYIEKCPRENYFTIPRYIVELGLKATTFKGLVYLYYRKGQDIAAFPSIRQMAYDLDMSTKTVQNIVKELEEKKLFSKKRRHYRNPRTKTKTRAFRSNRYRKYTRFQKRLDDSLRAIFTHFFSLNRRHPVLRIISIPRKSKHKPPCWETYSLDSS